MRKIDVDKLIRIEKKYPVEAVKYVAYTYTDRYWVIIEHSDDGYILRMERKDNLQFKPEKIKSEFINKLKEEMFRLKIMDDNIKLREYLIKQSFLYTPQTNSQQALTPEEERELERIIKEVEMEIKKETEELEVEDEIKKRWEDTNERKKRRK